MYSLEHTWSKAPYATLALGSLTTWHLVPRLHCILDACQQWTQATSRFGKDNA